MRRVLVRAAALVALLLSLLATPAASPAEPDVATYRVGPVITSEDRTAVASTGADITEVGTDSVVVRATRQERRAVARLGFTVVPVAGPDTFPAADAAYHDYGEMVADVDGVVAAHPGTAHRFSLGSSYEGRDLVGVRVSDDAADRSDEPGVVFVALHHAREHLTVEVALSLLHLFTESTDPTVAALVQTRQIYIIPNLNPDGAEYDIATGQYRMWRKNRQPTGSKRAIGTDLNRNYDYHWGCCHGSSPRPGSETYRGSAPFSAPETDAMRRFVDAHPNISTAISYHSFGGLILYPYGYTFTDVPSDMTQIDHDTFVAMAAEMARTTGYTPEQTSDLYITSGDFGDWLYGIHHAYPFTIELSGGTFYPPASFIPEETAKNKDAAVYVAQMADCPTRAAGVSCG